MTKLDFSLEAKHAENSWGDSYDILWPIILSKKLHIGAEVGVAYGGHAERILSKTKAILYCIDPYLHLENYDDPMNINQKDFDRLSAFTRTRLSRYGKRAVFIRKKSLDAADTIKKPLDFVYLDANHSYEGVSSDIQGWFSNIRDGGVISGHDYNHPDFPGVKRAVDEFFSRFSWSIHTHPSGVWWVEKLPLNITFIVPAYNCASTIAKSVKSIYEGNFREGDELIIVDDASTDKTNEVIAKLHSKYPHLSLIRHSYNKGGGATRNTAIRHAKNALIFCLDSDNILVKGTVSALKKTIISTKSSLTSVQEIRFYENDFQVKYIWVFSRFNYDLKSHFETNEVPGSSGNYLFLKRAWEEVHGYPEFAQALDTWGFSFKLAAHGYYATVAKNTFYWHRLSRHSYWQSSSKSINYSLVALQLITPYLKQINPQIVRYIFSGNHCYNWFNRFPIPKKYNLVDLVNKLKNIVKNLLNHFQKDPVWHQTLEQWGQDHGDKTLCLTYPLNPKSVVFEIGGYEGQWTSDIYAKYNSYIYVFEPITQFSDSIKNRFIHNKKIKVIPAAASYQDGYAEIVIDHDRTSLHNESKITSNLHSKIKLVNLSKYILDHHFSQIDLMQINIEGAEYDLLESLCLDGTINKIKYLQVQFHKFVPNAVARRNKILSLLNITHISTFSYPFVWEGWLKK